jgi:diguanylate cyclase (GGDEF)-like protein/PAS domain S-box-containing protein
MQLEIQTLAFISSLVFITECIALLIQFFVNRTYRGLSWWLLGISLWAFGDTFMPMVYNNSVIFLTIIANPLIVLGQIFIYIGILKFLKMKVHRRLLIVIFGVFLVSYFYFLFARNDLSGRTFIIAAVITLVSFMTSYKLLFNKDKYTSSSRRFSAIVFLVYGCFSLYRIYLVLSSPPFQSYTDQGVILEVSFIIPLIISLLSTFSFIIMLNQRLNAEIREEKEKLQLIFNTSPDGVLISRFDDGMIVDVNTGFLRMSGYSRTELINHTTLDINVWQQVEDRESYIKTLNNNGTCENEEFIFRRKNESLFNGSLSGNIILIQGVRHIVSIIHDITKNKLAEDAIRESEELYRSILNASPDNITITDLLGNILVVSPAAINMFGFGPEYEGIIGSKLVGYIVPKEREQANARIKRMLKGEPSGPNEYHGIKKDGSIIDIEVNSGIIHNANGKPSKMVFVVRDITERKQDEQQIQLLVRQLEIEKTAALLNANTDSLTGLANRRFFDDALKTEYRRMKRSRTPLSLVMLDVDYFKKYNDTYGHVAGDECLRQIGTSLKTLVGRTTDIVARYGGEEFIAILTDTDQSGAATLAERIRQTVERLAIPHSTSGISDYVTISLGVVTIHSTSLIEPERAVTLVDEALYCAKKDGRNRISVAIEPLDQDYDINYE